MQCGHWRLLLSHTFACTLEIRKRLWTSKYVGRLGVGIRGHDDPINELCSPHQVDMFSPSNSSMFSSGANIQQVWAVPEEVWGWCAAAPSRRCRQPLGQDHGRRVQSDERRHLWHGRQCPRQVFSFQVGVWLGVKCLVNLMCFWLVSYWLLLQAPWIPQRRGSEWQPGDVY